MSAIGIIAADPYELRPLLTRLQPLGYQESTSSADPFLRRCTSAQHELVLVAAGPGFRLAARAVEAAMQQTKLEELWSVGVCGGLRPSLRVGDVMEAGAVLDVRRGITSPTGAEGGTVVSMDRVAWEREEKSYFSACGDVVEMEAAVVASLAQSHGLRFRCFKSVSDTAEEDMPFDLNQYRAGDGSFRKGAIAMAVLRSPSSIPALRRLRANAMLAADTLGGRLAQLVA
jgi:adenosylhomocysteine nucleosidase